MIGKVNDGFFKKYILTQTGGERPEVVVGPQMGVDAAILKIQDKYMAIAEDPIFPSPTTSPEDFAWITVHIGASDVAVTGIKPQFMTYSLLLPPGTSEEYVADLVNAISRCAADLDISIVGGHTGFYGAVTVPTIGGITVWGWGDEYITPAGAQVGDKVIITKGTAIEAAGILASELGDKLIAAGIPEALVARARQRFLEMSVVKDARIAYAVGGVHAMHDATEGGLCRGLWEVAEASGVGLRIDRKQVMLPPDVKAVCDYFKLNPYEVISEGTLVLTCSADKAQELLHAFKANDLEAAIIGEVVPQSSGRYWVIEDRLEELVPPEIDEFWEVFFNALELKDDTRNEKAKVLCAELDLAVSKLQEMNIHNLIPEIGANLAYALPEAENLQDIAAIPGRLLRYKGEVFSLGKAEMGCSQYMGGSLLAIRKHFPETRCLINLRSNDAIIAACQKAGFKIANMPAIPDFRQTDPDFYRDMDLTLNTADELPEVISIPDRINLEKLILIPAKNLSELVKKINLIL